MRRAAVPIVAWFASAGPLQAQDSSVPNAAPPADAQVVIVAPKQSDHYALVEEFTAQVLAAGEAKIGTDLEVGLTDKLMLGTDLVATAVGAPSIAAKAVVYHGSEHEWALGLRAAYLSKNTFLWGSVNEHFKELDARVVRPSLSWTKTLSPRLKLHTFWAKGFGKVKATLSEKGERKLWQTKHPGANYDSRNQQTKAPAPSGSPDDASNTTSNQEKDIGEQSSLTQQSLQVQSITGLAQERFQLTGEFARHNGNKVLVTSRIEQSQFENLHASFFRLTAAHQWVWTSFQMRLGVGLQYFVMSGNDLDGEAIDAAGVQPASDISFYWRL